MSDDLPTAPDPVQNESSAKRAEFLRRVFHYERLPTHWELCQLSAMVGVNVPDIGISAPENEAEKRVELAMSIWRTAAIAIEKEQERREPAEQRFTERIPLYGALKVGNHLLPKVTELNPNHHPPDDPDHLTISLERFEEIVIGLSKPEQRRSWWRAYLKAKVKADSHRNRWGFYERIGDEVKEDPDWYEPDDTPLEDGVIDSIVRRQRENGIAPGFSAKDYLEGFRLWRLTMSAPDKKANTPYNLEDCVENALEESEGSKS